MIGLSLVTLFSIVTVAATLSALVQQASNLAVSSAGPIPEPGDYPAPLNRSALATVLDVDAYDYDDQPILGSGDEAAVEYRMVDISFEAWNDYEGRYAIDVVSMDWDSQAEVPVVGDKLSIRYRSADPEYAPQLATTNVAVPDPAAPPFPVAGSSGAGVPVAPALRWTIAVSGLLTLLTLIGTVIWARRAAPAEGTAAPGGWSQPGWPQPGGPQPGWPQPGGPQPGWPQPGSAQSGWSQSGWPQPGRPQPPSPQAPEPPQPAEPLPSPQPPQPGQPPQPAQPWQLPHAPPPGLTPPG